MKKLIKDGKVAVLISPEFGAGWSTWAIRDAEEMLFDADIANAVLNDDFNAVETLAKLKYPNEFNAGIAGLEVRWIDQGTEFVVQEYDGAESIRYKDGIIWSVA